MQNSGDCTIALTVATFSSYVVVQCWSEDACFNTEIVCLKFGIQVLIVFVGNEILSTKHEAYGKGVLHCYQRPIIFIKLLKKVRCSPDQAMEYTVVHGNAQDCTYHLPSHSNDLAIYGSFFSCTCIYYFFILYYFEFLWVICVLYYILHLTALYYKQDT